jgi:hypothetical protein
VNGVAFMLHKLSTTHETGCRRLEAVQFAVQDSRLLSNSAVSHFVHTALWMSCALLLREQSLQVNSLSTLSTNHCGYLVRELPLKLRCGFRTCCGRSKNRL